MAITWRINRELLSTPARRAVYLSMWVPNGLVVGCEALFVPYAPQAAAVLFVAVALGMLLGDMAAGRFLSPQLRQRAVTPLRFLLAAPFLLFVLPLSLPVAVAAAAIASTGFASTLLLQERLIALTGEEIRGQALGLRFSARTLTPSPRTTGHTPRSRASTARSSTTSPSLWPHRSWMTPRGATFPPRP